MKDDGALPELPITGHREIDTVHRRLGEKLDSLWNALGRSDREDAMSCALALLDGLRADYIGEEALMRASAYPGIDQHLEAHAALEAAFNGVVRRIRDVASPLDQGERTSLRRALKHVVVDLSVHVHTADSALARFLDRPPGGGES
jgi:hemerythrin-like metal-binding protein